MLCRHRCGIEERSERLPDIPCPPAGLDAIGTSSALVFGLALSATGAHNNGSEE